MIALCLIPLPSISAATALADMDPRPVDATDAVAPQPSQALASLAISVALPISARHGHRHPRMPDTTSASTTDVSGSQPGFGNCYNFKGGYAGISLKTAKVTRVTNGCVMIGYDDRQWAAPAERHGGLAHNTGHIIRTYCPMQGKSWKAMSNKVRIQLSMNYNFDDINNYMLAYVNRIFAKRYKQWKNDLMICRSLLRRVA
ncbi:hypothetical protein C1H46_006229 [Malus baccata]|uniref:Uncharacterized protein n=1 Tax=Malus baccata TaxID=106549 RepID=A0A540NBZ4_MALBA|nr:hypothetical protein C1H46_006229 [Malus baccata]